MLGRCHDMMDALKKMLDEYRIPPVIEIKTKFDKTRLPKAEEVLLARLQEKKLPIRPDMRIAITGGSRGIADYPAVMRAAVRYIKACGAVPFIVPAMGAMAGPLQGQVEVLKNLGITEETVGAPIYSSMDVVEMLPERNWDSLFIWTGLHRRQMASRCSIG